MKSLYDTSSFQCSKLVTNTYSTSFSLGIMLINKTIRMHIYSIYGFVRLADEIVDTFHDYDKENLLKRFIKDTHLAIEEGISLNPILNSFQHTVNKYGIEKEVIDTFLKSMEMDLSKSYHNEKSFQEYIYGSAEVVGLMCLSVFVEGNRDLYPRLKLSALKLGAAFQKVNFLRDMNHDYKILGRTYFPNIQLKNFDQKIKTEIEQDVQKDFDLAIEGILQLPKSSRFGVYLAYKYYLKLFDKIKKVKPEKVLSARIRIPNRIKLALLIRIYFKHRLALAYK
jgi:15-cis-phytoene synthase